MSSADMPTYIPNPKHRAWRANESQWTITESEEYDAFEVAWFQKWCEDGKGFGLHLVEGQTKQLKAHILGVIEDHETEVFVAKFVSDPNLQWHGFPADHKKKQDRPGWPILRKWIDLEVASAPKIRKIACGQRCIL